MADENLNGIDDDLEDLTEPYPVDMSLEADPETLSGDECDDSFLDEDDDDEEEGF